MEFSRRGPAADDPPPHGDPMLVMRDALLAQLHKDRLRQEIIVSELAKMERALALRAASDHQATPMPRHGSDTGTAAAGADWPFRGHVVGWEHYAGVDYEHDVKPECLKPCEGKGGQQNAASDEQKLPGSGETVPINIASPAVKCELIGITIPVKKPKAAMKWSCAVCQVQVTCEKNLQDHCAGHKHQSNVAALESGIKANGPQKAKTIAEPPPGTEQVKTSSIQWSCSTCQAKGTSGSTFESHLKGRRHLKNIAATCTKGGGSDDMPKKVAPQEEKSHDSNVPRHGERPSAVWSCSICQAKGTSGSTFESHLQGRRHLQNIAATCTKGGGSDDMPKKVAPQEEKSHDSNVPRHGERPSAVWSCSICQAKGTSGSTFESHLKGRRHLQNIAATCTKGGGSDDMPKKVAPQEEKSHDSNVPRHGERPSSVWSCSICQAICTCESDLKNHLKGKRHSDNVGALLQESKNMARKYSGPLKAKLNPHSVPKHIHSTNSRWFCRVCHAYCTCEADLENHLRGRRHQLNIYNPPRIA